MIPSALRPFFLWCDSAWISGAIRDSTWLFAVIEIFHLLGLTLLLGSMVVLDLRLLGFGMRRQPVSRIAAELTPWIWGGLAFMVTTGALMFFAEALKCFASPPFAIKMTLLAAAVAVHLAIVRGARGVAESAPLPGWTRPAAILSLILWFGVGVAGRAIGFQ